MMIGRLYSDSMDHTRKLEVLDHKGNCRVYFDGLPFGKVKVTPKLFSDDARTHIGFNLIPDKLDS